MSSGVDMTPANKSSHVREEWIERQRELGKQPRAVLMKGLHARINCTIDRWHRKVLRAAFAPQGTSNTLPCLDLGCGYGRLANEASALGLTPVVGIDFARGFCSDFRRDHGMAVCGDIALLPFAEGSFSSAYSVTSYMYLPIADAHRAAADLDRCLAIGARVLVVEPGREFNSLVRSILRRKRNESLAMPGFTLGEFQDELVPGNWRLTGSGSSRWMTVLLPLLMMTSGLPAVYRQVERLALWLDTPQLGKKGGLSTVTMYRWAAYEKTGRTDGN